MVCSAHFTADDFEQRYSMEGSGNRRLKSDELGVTVFPTVQPVSASRKPSEPTDRDRRMVSALTAANRM